MMKPLSRLLLLALAALVVPACGSDGDDGGGAPAPIQERALFALEPSNILAVYTARALSAPLARFPISGVTGELLAIDYRPLNGELLAVSDADIVYAVNPLTGAATAKGAAFSANADIGTNALLGFDVNPATDQIRVTSTTGQHFRLHPSTGAWVATDGAPSYAIGDVNFGQALQVAALAHSNNFAGTATSGVFGLDLQNDRLLSFGASPNLGQVSTIGSLGVNATNASFDISSDGLGVAALEVGGITSIYVIAPNGAATLEGQLGGGAAIRGMTLGAFPAFQPAAGSIVALLKNNVLVNHPAATPETLGSPAGVLTVSGLSGTVVGLDYRPLNGRLFAVTDDERVYAIDAVTGAATAVGPAAFAPALSGGVFGVDFNPSVDRLRVVSDLEQNLRLDPGSGATAATDLALAYHAMDVNAAADPDIAAAAYSNNVPGTATTTLFVIDRGLDVLATQDPPNDGVLNTVGALGVDCVDAAFDISPAGLAFAALKVGTVTGLYSINVASGQATLIDVLGGGLDVAGLTVR